MVNHTDAAANATMDTPFLGAPGAEAWLAPLAVAFGGLLAGVVLARVLVGLARKGAERTETDLDDVLVAALGRPVVWLVTLGSLSVAAGLAPLDDDALGPTRTLLRLASLAVLGIVGARVVLAILTREAKRRPSLRAVAPLVRRAVASVFALVVLLMGLEALGYSITPVLTTMGLAGLAFALALQDTLGNFFAGLHLQADRPIREGDYIKLVEENIEGYVDRIGWRSTRIRQLANNLVIIPNSKLADALVVNYYLPEPRMSLLIPVSVPYGVDTRRVEALLVDEAKRAAKDVPGLLETPEPFVRFIPGYGASSLDFTVICQVREYVDQYLAQHELRHRFLGRLAAEGISMPFPTRTLHVVGAEARPQAALDGEARRVL
ncbi:MAG TPA: mechanosensitive ion channel family protein [Candidatus Thermoplasmatota archaeon]|nr:mechanosensitive ion channel family protein [Candidatus Thermoplasmatota archaeon]